MSETSLDNTICASAAEPEQGLGGSGSEEQHSLGGRIDGRGAGPGVLSGMLTVDQIARMRWQVLPCHPTGHQPPVVHGFYLAMIDPDAIKSWWSGLPTPPFSLFAGQMLPDKNAAATVGNGGETLSLLVTDERIDGREADPGEMPALPNAQNKVHIWNGFQEIRDRDPKCPPLRQITYVEAPRARACQKQRDKIRPAADVEEWKGGAKPHGLLDERRRRYAARRQQAMPNEDTAAGEAAGWAARKYRVRSQFERDTFGLTAEVTG